MWGSSFADLAKKAQELQAQASNLRVRGIAVRMSATILPRASDGLRQLYLVL